MLLVIFATACTSDSEVDPVPLAPVALPYTGKVISVHPGDDADLQIGISWPQPRFASHSNGTVTDNLTGLIWLKSVQCYANRLSWSDAITAANTLSDNGTGVCGLTDGSQQGDWRLPNTRELLSVSYRGGWQGVDIPFPFYGIHSQHYWSSTTDAMNAEQAWVDYTGFIRSYNKSSEHWLWPVRGGLSTSANTITYATRLPRTGQTTSYMAGDDGDWQAGVELPELRYRDDGNGTVTDTLTGLVWLKDSRCISQWYPWHDAVKTANAFADDGNGGCGLNDGSKPGDWRLPNVLELHSVVDYGRTAPALSAGHPAFSVLDMRAGWTSTGDFFGAFELNLLRGGIDEGDGFDFSLTVWPVRNAL